MVISAQPDVIAHYRGTGIEWHPGTVTFRTLGWTDDDRWVLLATTALESAMSHDTSTIDFDRPELARLDEMILWLGDVLTLARGKPFRVMATRQSLGLLGTDVELEQLRGLDLNMPSVKFAYRCHDPIELTEFAALGDRPDGVALLSEAMSHTNPLGRYGQLLRVLERAFGRQIGKFDAELQRFLADGATRHWFTRREIAHWISGRPRVFHADYRDRELWFQRDLERVVDRFEEAAIDVLFNKLNWNVPDDVRRRQHVPRQGSIDADGGWFTSQGQDFNANLQMIDPFGSFRMEARSLDSAATSGLWAVATGESMVLRFVGGSDGGTPADPPTPDPAVLISGARFMIYAADDDSVRDPDDEATVTG